MVDVFQMGLAAYGLMFVGRSRMAGKVALVWLAILLSSLALLQIYGYSFDILAKQGIPAACVYVGYCCLLERTTPISLLKAYKKVCFYAALFGLVQYALSMVGIPILMGTPGRLDSLAYEPSHYAIAVAPAAYLCVRGLIRSGKKMNYTTLVIIGSLLLTVSLTAFIIMLVCSIIFVFQKQGAIIAISAMTLAFYFYTHREYLPETVRDRIEATEQSMEKENTIDSTSNLTILSPLTNWKVAMDTMEKGRILGNGLGGHRDAYLNYYKGSAFSMRDRFETNSIGGHCLFIRSVSEFGLLGMVVYVWWLFKGLASAAKGSQIWWTLSAVYMVGRSIKLAGFFELGLPIFILAPLIFYRKYPVPVRKRRLGRVAA